MSFFSLLNFDETLKAVNGKACGCKKDKNAFCFSNVQTDSRNVEKASLFVPLIGEKQDGHKYVPLAIKNGASVIFINNDEYKNNSEKYDLLCNENENLFIIAVENTLKALQDAASFYVCKFPSLIKIGITGSSGKTTTKEMIVFVLKQKFNVVYTKGNFNSETGLPLSVFNIRKEHEVGVFEMGMNRKNEIAEIASVLKPEYAVITNIGTAHIGILKTRENIAREKRNIFNYISKNGKAFIPAEDDFKDFLCENVKGKVEFYGSSVPESVSGVKYIKDEGLNGTIFSIDGLTVHLKNPGIYNYRNALASCAVAKTLSVSAEQIKLGLESLGMVSGRMETQTVLLKNSKKITLIKDCYNANPDSVASVLNFCSSINNVNKKIFVLGDMLELGEKSALEHRMVGEKILSAKPDFVILIGKEMQNAADFLSEKEFKNVKYFPLHDEESIENVSKTILSIAQDADVVLLKASRGLSLERIIPLIQESNEKQN